MTKKFDDLNETFNVSGEIVETKVESVDKIEKVSSSIEDVKKDYEYTRGNL
jgi:methyl-accepting chemotaxis protein